MHCQPFINYTIAVTMFLAGCATTGGSQAVVSGADFTSQDELNQILTQPSPASFLDTSGIFIENWELQGDLPSHIGATPSSTKSQWLEPLKTIARAKAGLVLHTTQLDCVAKQTGLFWLEKKALPATEMYTFIASRCGVPEARVSIQYLSGEVPADFSESTIWDQWKDDIAESTRKAIGSGMKSAGAFFVRNDTHAGFFIAIAQRKLFLEPIPRLVQDSTTITVRGELLESAEELVALTTKGQFGFADCSVDASLQLPAFALSCVIDPDSPNTKIDIQSRAPGRILGNQIAQLEFFKGNELPKHQVNWDYQLSSIEVPPGDLPQAITHYANHVRSLAKMQPLTLEPKQSETGVKALPHYFGAMTGKSSPVVADRIALGLLAGWDVNADVISGNIQSAAIYGTNEPSKYIETMLSGATGRSLLLNPDASLLAASMYAHEKPEAVVGILTTYEELDRKERDAHRAAVLEKLNAQKEAKGLPAAKLNTGISDLMSQSVQKFERGQVDLDGALNEMLQKVANKTGASVQAFYIESSDLESIVWDDNVLKNRDELQIALAYNQSDDEAWSRYVVFLIFVKSASI